MDGLLIMCSTITLTLLLSFLPTLLARLKRRNSHPHLPLGSSGLPFLGETLSFVSSAYSTRPESFVDKRRHRFGKVFRSHLFGSPTIVSADAEVSKIVLQSDARAFVPSYPRSLTELMGESSILLINGSLQRRVHGLIGAFFNSQQLKTQITADMERYVAGSMRCWADGEAVRLQDHARQITFQVLVKVLISLEPGEELIYLKQQFRIFISGLMSLPVKFPGTRLYRSLQAKQRMVKLVKSIIRMKRENPSHAPKDVVDVLISGGSDQLTDDLISDNMIDLMIPGEDSVPILIVLAVKYLSACPRALCQIQEENLELKDRKIRSGEQLCWMDYMALPFTQDVISETLRLGNIISGVMRKATRDVEIKGYFIPKGWCVLTYFRSIHLDGGLYDDASEFKPWRWQNKETRNCYFTPFGGGQRLCPGLDLARLEASIFLHHLVTNFTWRAEADVVVNFPTVRMRGGLPIRVQRRRKDTP